MTGSSASASIKMLIVIFALAATPAISFAQTIGAASGATASADATVNAENQLLDKKMKSICRGC